MGAPDDFNGKGELKYSGRCQKEILMPESLIATIIYTPDKFSFVGVPIENSLEDNPWC